MPKKRNYDDMYYMADEETTRIGARKGKTARLAAKEKDMKRIYCMD
jgi:hypothetical protein